MSQCQEGSSADRGHPLGPQVLLQHLLLLLAVVAAEATGTAGALVCCAPVEKEGLLGAAGAA